MSDLIHYLFLGFGIGLGMTLLGFEIRRADEPWWTWRRRRRLS